MSRQFAKTAVKVPGSHAIPAYQITCSKCGVTEKITTNNHSGCMPPDATAQKFRNKGWLVSSRDGRDVCPECQERDKKVKLSVIKEENTNVVALKNITDAPREINKEDRRLIFARINDFYLDNSYSGGWSDKKIADDLGVPVAWVKNIREENFGPEGLNEDNQRIIEEAKAISDKISEQIEMLKVEIKKAETLRDDMTGRVKNLQNKLADIHKIIS
jgi:hypothetical protein